MKILITMNLPYFPAVGGANKGNRRLAEGLAKNGHFVQVVVPALASPSMITRDQLRGAMQEQGIAADSRNDIDRYRLNNVDVHAVYDPARLRNYFIEQVNEFDPDWCLVSTEDPSQNLLGAALKASPGRVAYLVHSPMFLPFGPYSLFPGRQRTNLIKQAAVIACSKFVA